MDSRKALKKNSCKIFSVLPLTSVTGDKYGFSYSMNKRVPVKHAGEKYIFDGRVTSLSTIAGQIFLSVFPTGFRKFKCGIDGKSFVFSPPEINLVGTCSNLTFQHSPATFVCTHTRRLPPHGLSWP